jgi:phospholipase A2
MPGGSEEATVTERGLSSTSDQSKKSSSITDKISGLVHDLKPNVKAIKSFFALDSKVSQDLMDTSKFPEVSKTAEVRHGMDLCPEEKAFVAARKQLKRDSFARYMGWDPAAIHPDDVPTVAFGGSGGGYRAMLAMLGYSKAMKESGLWDLLMYVSGVSGSCEYRSPSLSI